MDYNKVWSIQHKYNISNVKMAEIVGLKRSQSYTDMMEAKSMKVVYLENICKHFKMDVSEFIKTAGKSEKDQDNEVLLQEPTQAYRKTLCPTCAAKDQTIELLKDRIKHQEKIIDSCLTYQNKATGT